jgi:hypothetical protein
MNNVEVSRYRQMDIALPFRLGFQRLSAATGPAQALASCSSVAARPRGGLATNACANLDRGLTEDRTARQSRARCFCFGAGPTPKVRTPRPGIVRQTAKISRFADKHRLRMAVIGRFCCRSQLLACANSDSVALTRSAVEAADDGTAEARTRAIFLLIPP